VRTAQTAEYIMGLKQYWKCFWDNWIKAVKVTYILKWKSKFFLLYTRHFGSK